MLWFSSNAGVDLLAVYFTVFGGGVLALLTAIRIAFFIVARRHTASRVPIRWFVVWIFVCLAAGVIATVAEGPRNPLFRWRFRLSEHALTDYARAAAAAPNHSPAIPHRVGLFFPERIDIHDGQVRVITTPCGVVDACGIVYSPAGPPTPWQEDVFSHLSGPWWHLFEGF